MQINKEDYNYVTKNIINILEMNKNITKNEHNGYRKISDRVRKRSKIVKRRTHQYHKK